MMSTLIKIDYQNYLQSEVAHNITTDIEYVKHSFPDQFDSYILKGLEVIRSLLVKNPSPDIYVLSTDDWVRFLIYYTAFIEYRKYGLSWSSDNHLFGNSILNLIRR